MFLLRNNLLIRNSRLKKKSIKNTKQVKNIRIGLMREIRETSPASAPGLNIYENCRTIVLLSIIIRIDH